MEFEPIFYFVVFGLIIYCTIYISLPKSKSAQVPNGRGLLVTSMLFEIRERNKSALMHSIPPRDGPSLATTGYTREGFSCECYEPANWWVEHDDAPSPLRSVSGFIENPRGDVLIAMILQLPKKGSTIVKIVYSFSMSSHRSGDKRVARGMHYEIDVYYADGTTFSLKNCFLGERVLAELHLDTLFRSLFPSTNEAAT